MKSSESQSSEPGLRQTKKSAEKVPKTLPIVLKASNFSQNVTKSHISEIFGFFGKISEIEIDFSGRKRDAYIQF